MAMLAPLSDHDRAAIGPRSHSDRTTIASRWGHDPFMKFLSSDEDRAAAHDCAFDEDRTLHLRPRVGR